MTTYRRLFAVAMLWAIQGCENGYDIPTDAELVQTAAVVRAPLNRGGKVVIEHGGREVQKATIDDHGDAQVNLPGLQGDFTAKVTGGYYLDPITGDKVAMHGQALHGYARGVGLLGRAKIAVTPWSELLYRYWLAHPEGNALSEAEKALDGALGCGMAGTALALPTAPSAEAPVLGTGHGEMGYVHLGAWKQLAALVGEEVGLSKDGVSPMQLVEALSHSIEAHGRITGQIEVAPRRFIDAGVLRQRYAQAMRWFVEGEPAHVSLRTAPIKALLECVSEASADMWGPAGEKLDLTAPEIIELDVPEIFASSLQVTCRATDASTVKDVRLEVRQHNVLMPAKAMPGAQRFAGKNTPEATLSLTLDPNFLEDGDVSITCLALDRWDNASSKTAASSVNRNLGQVFIDVSPRDDETDGAHVKGEVTITCECRDRYLVKDNACGLSAASLAVPGISDGTFESGKATYIWDTLQGLDGRKHLVCQGRSAGIKAPKLGDPRDVWVQNHKPAKPIVHVHLDTPIRGMQVTAYAFEAGQKGRELGRSSAATSELGEADMSIRTDYTGPILFEAAAQREMNRAKPAYKALALGEDMRIDAHVLSLVWDDYSPARGDLPQELHINAATTLAKALAVGVANHGGGSISMADAIYRAHELVGKHLNPDEPGMYGLDPRRTAVADLSDLSSRNTAKSDNSIRLGLFHVGLSRLAAEAGEASARSYSALELLDLLCQDAAGGVLDGRAQKIGKKKEQLGLGRYPLTTETLRRDLASATRRWLRNDALHGQVYLMSQLAPRDFSRRGQYLVTLAEDESMMFGAKGAKPFDEDGPILTLKIRQGGIDDESAWTEMPASNQTFRGFVHLEAWAEDDSDVVDLDVSFGGANLVNGMTGISGDKFDLGSAKAHANFTVNTALFDDGEVTINMQAKDRIGNSSNLPMVLTIDNKKPQVTLAPRWTSHDGNVTIVGQVDKAFRDIRIEQSRTLEGTFTSNAEGPEDRTFAIPVNLACDANHTLTVTATDYAGNESDPLDVVVWCDSQRPIIHWVPTTYEMEYAGGRTSMQSGMTLQKHLHRLGRQDNNRAAVRFYVDDRSQEPARFGSRPQDMRAQYQFEFHSGGRIHVTDWKTLDAIEDAAFPEKIGYEVDFTYESMLPSETQQLNAVAIRAANHIARSSPDDMHVLVVQVADEAGNISEERFSAHLDIRSAPVKLTCAVDNVANTSSLALENMQRLAAKGQRPFSMTAEWKISEEQTDTASEMAPLMSEVTARVVLPTIKRHTAVSQVTKQIAVLKRGYARNREDGRECGDHGRRWARVWNDKECEAHDDDTRPSTTPIAGSPAFSQSLTPDKSIVFLRGAPAVPEHVLYTTVDAAPFEVARDAGGRQRLQFRFRTAVEYERHVSWGIPDWVYLDERLFAGSAMMFHNLRGASVSVDTFPAPSAVVLGETCTRMWSYRG